MLHVKDEWGDVEADEVDFRKGLAPDHEDAAEDQKVVWEQWGGVVERGYPETLVLTRLKPKGTKERAPGPGPMRLKDWQPFLAKRLRGRKIILHTDGARAYQNKADGVIHDNVVHKKKESHDRWQHRLAQADAHQDFQAQDPWHIQTPTCEGWHPGN